MSTRYVLQKLLRAFLTIFIIVSFVFIALRLSGDAALQIYGADVDEAVLQALRKSWGLDKPIWQQYLGYIANIFRGDLGTSYLDGRDAVEVVMERVPKTLSLMWIPAGIYAALNHNTALDRATMTMAVMGLSVPNFFWVCC